MADVYSLSLNQVYELLQRSVYNLCNEHGVKDCVNFLVEEPQVLEFGDFASNVAMVAAKHFKMSPLKLADKIVANMSLNGSYFAKCEIKKPGFINFFFNNEWYVNALQNILNDGVRFGYTNFGNGEKVLLEFVSANPTGPMHIGNARGGAIGDSLAECFKFAGFDVKKEFYVNDAGNQIEKFKKSLAIRYEQIYKNTPNFVMPPDCYQGQDIAEHAAEFAKIYGAEYVDVSEQDREQAILSYALPINIKNLKLDLLKYKVEYDNWFFESNLYKDKKIYEVIDILTEKGYTFEKDGALWFCYSKCGGAKDEVLIRENKIPTYFASDIAYHYNKFKIRGFNKAINIWGADHHGHVDRLKAALNVLGVERSALYVVLMQMVRIVKKGEAVKLSKRLGNSITLNSLLDLIPIDVARFFFNMREPNSHFDFDLDLACEQSDNNPVYYVQYAYARICGILKKLEGFNFSSSANFSLLNSFEELDLIKHIAKFPFEIIEAVKGYNPSKIARFCLDVAAKFHKFYGVCRIKGEAKDLIDARLGLCEAVRITLKNAFKILKITAREEV